MIRQTILVTLLYVCIFFIIDYTSGYISNALDSKYYPEEKVFTKYNANIFFIIFKQVVILSLVYLIGLFYFPDSTDSVLEYSALDVLSNIGSSVGQKERSIDLKQNELETLSQLSHSPPPSISVISKDGPASTSGLSGDSLSNTIESY